MPLWGSDDNEGKVPFYANSSNSAATTLYGNCYGVSSQEMANSENIKVTHSGWNALKVYVDCTGMTRVKSQCLVAGDFIVGDDDDDNTFFANTTLTDE